MSEKIKILMLGDSRSGKTCFMLGMYAAIQNGSKFSLKATDPDEGVEMATLWSTIVGESGEERWPLPTIYKPKIYNFELCYAYKSLIEFEWLDYRGGSMLDISSDDNVRTLRNYAAESNGLFFCISGKDLREPVTEANLQNIAIKSKANLMGQYLQYLNINRRPARKKSFPIIIMVTKYDYCYHRNKRELMEDVKKMFPPLFAPNSDWLVMICPVTLGKELAKNSDNGKIEPRNLDIPVAFVLYCILTEQARIQDEKFTEIDDQLEVLESNLFNRWINRRKIKRLNESLRQAEMQFKKTIEMINVLAREQDLSSTDIYLSGKKIQIDLDLS